MLWWFAVALCRGEKIPIQLQFLVYCVLCVENDAMFISCCVRSAYTGTNDIQREHSGSAIHDDSYA